MSASRDRAVDAPELAARYGHLMLFSDVDLSAVAHLLANCEEIDVAAGTTILEEGTLNDAIYIVLAGGVSIRLGSADAEPLVELGVGACVGELSILSQLDVSAFVTSSLDSTLLMIRDEQLWSLIANSHAFACNLLRLMSGRIREDNTRLRESLEAQKHFARASRVDALTGLYNRRGLDEVMRRQCQRSARDGNALSLLLIDIDNFKKINDTFGHLRGDEALKCVADALRASTRPTDLAARYGGEEFALVLHDIDLFAAAEIGERIRDDIARARLPATGSEIAMTVSVGVAELETNADPESLMADADRALYRAKRLGRNRVVVASDLTEIEVV